MNKDLEFDEGLTALFNSKGNFLALIEKNENIMKYRFVEDCKV